MPSILKSSESYFLLSIVSCHSQEGDVNSNHRGLYNFDIDNLSKKERVLMPVPFSFAKIPIKKDMYRTFGSQHGYGLSDRNHEKHNILGMSEFLRIECYLPNESRCSYNKRIDSHTTRSTGQPPTVPLHPVIPCFLGTEHQERVSYHQVVSKRYHICDTFRGT